MAALGAGRLFLLAGDSLRPLSSVRGKHARTHAHPRAHGEHPPVLSKTKHACAVCHRPASQRPANSFNTHDGRFLVYLGSLKLNRFEHIHPNREKNCLSN